ncbi:MAG: hypothetical protein ABIU96_04095 [Rhodanobacter sp.]
MTSLRPIGHIACNLTILALMIVTRMRVAPAGVHYACWVDDDGCVYLAVAHHPRAAAMLRHAPEQRINSYSKPRTAAFPLTHGNIAEDLQSARISYAERGLAQSAEAAA